jgi:hypothetical protein
MNAYEILEPLLRQGGSAALFPPLDDEGLSLALVANDAPIELACEPDEPDSLFFSLSMPLLSLEGAGPGAQLAFFWHLAETSAPGALPPGYVVFGDWEALSVSLGGQFSAQGLELGLLETLTEEFYRFGRALRESLAERLEAFAAGEAPAGGGADELPPLQELLKA